MGKYKDDRGNNSLFGPIVLIAVGVFWLLSNFGLLPVIEWGAILRLWPLLLIFWGLNLIFRSAPRPFNALLSALLGVIAVGVFAFLILFGNSIPLVGSLEPPTVSKTDVLVPLDGATSAEIKIETSIAPVEINTLSSGDSLVAGQVSYIGDMIIDSNMRGDEVTVRIDTRTPNGWFLDPANWNQFDEDDQWELALSPNIPLKLEIDAASGEGSYQLQQLQLRDFAFDGGSGAFTVVMPDGKYDANIDLASGSSSWTLPARGSGQFTFDGGSGSFNLFIPQGVEAQIAVDGGSGSFEADARFELVRGDREDGIWETAGYDSAENRLDINLDIGSGSVSVALPSGR